MTRSRETLTPPNEWPHFLLPGGNQVVSERASSHDSIVAVYRDGISFIDQAGAMQGFLTIVAVWGGALPLYAVLTYDYRRGVPFAVVMLTLLVIICVLMFRADNIKYHYYPVMFDRAASKVHLFVDANIPWWKLWQLVPPTRIETWDWAQARAEVVESIVYSGSAARSEYGLVCAITERPGEGKVIARFGVGLSSSYDGGEAMVQRWEHIRRFMCENGPHLAPGDTMYRDDSNTTLWHAITWGQPLLGPGSKEFWTGEAVNGWWFFTIPAGALFLVFLPFTVISGLLRTAMHRVRRVPKWSKEVLSSVGEQLADQDARLR